MKTRVLAAIPIGVLVVAAVFLQSWLLFGLIVFMSVVAQHEMLCAVSANGTKTVNFVPYIMTAVIPVLMFFGALGLVGLLVFFGMFMIFALMTVILFLVTMFSSKYNFASFRNTLVAMIYPEIFFVFMYLVFVFYCSFDWLGKNPSVILLCLLPAVFSDCLALFVGKAFGKRKLCPELSPKKTVAGAIGGVIGGVIAGVVIWILFVSGITDFSDNIPVALCIITAAVAAFASQIGDLAASFIKRHYGIKDFGRLIPGHGGILDRVDSWLFSFAVVFVIITLCMMAGICY